MTLTPDEANICRQWFNAVQDVLPAYLNAKDGKLAARLYEALGMRIPHSVTVLEQQPLNDRS